jgi:hypothetical protein
LDRLRLLHNHKGQWIININPTLVEYWQENKQLQQKNKETNNQTTCSKRKMKQTETGEKKEIYPAAGVHSSVSVAFDVRNSRAPGVRAQAK